MENTITADKYFAPQGSLYLIDTDRHDEMIKLGSCSQFTIKDNKFVLKLDNFCLTNLARIFESDLSKTTNYRKTYYKFDINEFNKVWKFEFNGINTANFQAPFTLSGYLEFNKIAQLKLVSDSFEPLILTGNVSKLVFAECIQLTEADATKKTSFLVDKVETKRDLAKVNSDLFKVMSLDSVFNRRDIVKISKLDIDKTKIDFISTFIEVAEPFSQVVKFFERYEDEQKMVKTINQNAEKLLDFLMEMRDHELWKS